MNDEMKQEIMLALGVLRIALIDTGTSMFLDSKNKSIGFFNIDSYLETGKMNGFSVDIDTLVK